MTASTPSILAPGAPDVLALLVDRDDLVRRGVELGRLALTDGTDRATYDELADLVARLAGQLVRLGARPGDRVAVHLRKSVHSFATVHAVLRAGAVMVPLDPLAPLTHVAAVLGDSGASVLVTDVAPAKLVDLLAGSSLRAVVTRRAPDDPLDGVDVVAWDAAVAGAPAPPAEVAPDDPAYVIYTSGSTGAPKGIVHTHRSALAYARLAATTYELIADDVLANIASLHFDQSTFELYAAPLVGAAVVVVPDALLRFPASTSELIERERVTVWYSVPYVLRQLVTRGALDQRDLSSMRWVLYGGEAYPPAELAALMRAIPSTRVSNVYGPAEVNQCTYFHLDVPPASDAPIPIGRAWAETELLVVDDDLHPVPAGGVGELLVATSTMMRGYWNRPDLTDAATVTIDGRRWYRTGDLVAGPLDELVFRGRVDHQVKVRGQRVELEAVDAALARLDGVAEAGVVAARDGDETELVAAVVTVVVDDAIDERAALRELAARLPAAAVPRRIARLDSIPRNANGKIDRGALADLLRVPPPTDESTHQ